MAKPNAQAPLGQGGRFAAMVASGKSPALAAAIGRKAHGKAEMTKLAAAGKKRARKAPVKKSAPTTPPASY